MKKLIERLSEWTGRQDERLRVWLASLPERTKIIVVLVIFGVFAIGALFTFGAALYQIGRENGRRIEIEHIEQFNLPQKQDSIHLFNHYDYGTEQKSHDQHERGEA